MLLTLAGLTYTPKRQQSSNQSIKLDPDQAQTNTQTHTQTMTRPCLDLHPDNDPRPYSDPRSDNAPHLRNERPTGCGSEYGRRCGSEYGRGSLSGCGSKHGRVIVWVWVCVFVWV